MVNLPIYIALRSLLFVYLFVFISVVSSLDDDDDNVFGEGIRSVAPGDPGSQLASLVPDTFSGESKDGLRSVDAVTTSSEYDPVEDQYDVVGDNMDHQNPVNATNAGESLLPTVRLLRIPACDDLPGLLIASQLGQPVGADRDPSMYGEIMVEMEEMNDPVNDTADGTPGPPPGTPEAVGSAGVFNVDFNGIINPLPSDSSSEGITFGAGDNLFNSTCMQMRPRSRTDDQTDSSGIPAGTFQVMTLIS